MYLYLFVMSSASAVSVLTALHSLLRLPYQQHIWFQKNMQIRWIFISVMFHYCCFSSDVGRACARWWWKLQLSLPTWDRVDLVWTWGMCPGLQGRCQCSSGTAVNSLLHGVLTTVSTPTLIRGWCCSVYASVLPY